MTGAELRATTASARAHRRPQVPHRQSGLPMSGLAVVDADADALPEASATASKSPCAVTQGVDLAGTDGTGCRSLSGGRLKDDPVEPFPEEASLGFAQLVDLGNDGAEGDGCSQRT